MQIDKSINVTVMVDGLPENAREIKIRETDTRQVLGNNSLTLLNMINSKRTHTTTKIKVKRGIPVMPKWENT